MNDRDSPLVTCKHCGETVERKREARRYCSERCRKADFKRRSVSPVSAGYLEKRPPASTPSTRGSDTPSYGFGRPGDPPLQGDDYHPGYYDDGFVKLPDCQRRK